MEHVEGPLIPEEVKAEEDARTLAELLEDEIELATEVAELRQTIAEINGEIDSNPTRHRTPWWHRARHALGHKKTELAGLRVELDGVRKLIAERKREEKLKRHHLYIERMKVESENKGKRDRLIKHAKRLDREYIAFKRLVREKLGDEEVHQMAREARAIADKEVSES